MLINPFDTARAVLIFLGIILLIYGAGELYNAWIFKKSKKNK
jgi:uncharacterized membrane protein HdeD (DUF308 family)